MKPNIADAPTTFFGRKDITLRLLDGTDLKTFVRKLALGEFDRAALLLQADNEIELTAFMCGEKGHDRKWMNQIDPDSYSELVEVAAQLNLSFFAYAGRQLGRVQARQATASNITRLVEAVSLPSSRD